MNDRDNAVTLGAWANMAIAKQICKMLEPEAGVIQDKDSEQ